MQLVTLEVFINMYMKFDDLVKKILNEDNLAGSGDVFGPGSVNTGELQGDHIYAPGDYRNVIGRFPLVSRAGAVKKKRKKRRKKR